MGTAYHSQYWAHALSLRGSGGNIESLSRSIANARVDLNPHQIDAALFALRSPLSNGAIFADEVGLGKTIEAGIVLAQRWAERRRRILIIVPAILRKQWQQELEQKFYLPCVILDTKAFNRLVKDGASNPFDQENGLVICSYHFASAKSAQISRVSWDVAVIDEAHRLRNVYRSRNRTDPLAKKSMSHKIADSLERVPKLLLTATPLQNSLMELYGLASVIDEHVFGDSASFREQFVRISDDTLRNEELKQRLDPICIRTLRKQVMEYVPFTRRVPITQEFLPSDAEHELYERVSSYLQRESLFALPASQRQLITLILRKLLASSTFAIARTLRRLVHRVENIQEQVELLDDEDLEGIDELEDEWQEDGADDLRSMRGLDSAIKDARKGWYNLDWKQAEARSEHFYRQDHPLAVQLIERAISRDLPPVEVTLNYSGYESKISILGPLVGQSGWLELSKLTIEALNTDEFLIFAAKADSGQVLDEEICGKLLLLPGQMGNSCFEAPDLSGLRQTGVQTKLDAIDKRNGEFFDEEVLKLDRWSEDLKQGLEREIKEIDKQIREARKTAALVQSLEDKLAAQKVIKALEKTRNTKRRELFDAQDAIDAQREELIEKIEKQLKQRRNVQVLFAIRWEVK